MNQFLQRSILVITLLFFSLLTFSQTSNPFMSYQGVVRASNGLPYANKVFNLRIKISDDPLGTNILYWETRQVRTNGLGAYHLFIGGPNTITNSANYESINWRSEKTKYLVLEVDLSNSGAYSVSAISQLGSVPFSMYAKEGGSSGLNTWKAKPENVGKSENEYLKEILAQTEITNNLTLTTSGKLVSNVNGEISEVDLNSLAINPTITQNMSLGTNGTLSSEINGQTSQVDLSSLKTEITNDLTFTNDKLTSNVNGISKEVDLSGLKTPTTHELTLNSGKLTSNVNGISQEVDLNSLAINPTINQNMSLAANGTLSSEINGQTSQVDLSGLKTTTTNEFSLLDDKLTSNVNGISKEVDLSGLKTTTTNDLTFTNDKLTSNVNGISKEVDLSGLKTTTTNEFSLLDDKLTSNVNGISKEVDLSGLKTTTTNEFSLLDDKLTSNVNGISKEVDLSGLKTTTTNDLTFTNDKLTSNVNGISKEVDLSGLKTTTTNDLTFTNDKLTSNVNGISKEVDLSGLKTTTTNEFSLLDDKLTSNVNGISKEVDLTKYLKDDQSLTSEVNKMKIERGTEANIINSYTSTLVDNKLNSKVNEVPNTEINLSELTLTGDVTGKLNETKVVKIQGKPVVETAPKTNEFLKFDGTNWVPTIFPNIDSLQSSVVNAPWGPNDAPILVVLGQSNSYGHGATLPAGETFTTGLANVKTLNNSDVNNLTHVTPLNWVGLTTNGSINIAQGTGTGLANVANQFGKKWQDHITAGNTMKLPDLYVVLAGWGGQGMQLGWSEDRWSPDRSKTDPNSLYWRISRTLKLVIQDLKAKGKNPRILAVHWNQWESEADANANTASIKAAENSAMNFNRIVDALNDATGSQELRWRFFKPLARNYPALNTEKVKLALESVVASDPLHRSFIDVTKAPFYNLSAGNAQGIFQADNVHYTVQSQKWFADQEWNYLLSGNKGIAVGNYSKAVTDLAAETKDLISGLKSTYGSFAVNAIDYTVGTDLTSTSSLEIGVSNPTSHIFTHKRDATTGNKIINIKRNIDKYQISLPKNGYTDIMNGEVIYKIASGSNTFLGAAFRVASTGIVGGGFNSVPKSYIALNLNNNSFNCWILFNSAIDVAKDKRITIVNTQFVNPIPTTVPYWLKFKLTYNRAYFQYSLDEGITWVNIITEDNTATGTPGKSWTWDTTRHAGLTNITSNGGEMGLILGVGALTGDVSEIQLSGLEIINK